MKTVYFTKSDPKELQRIQKLEWLDEVEEMMFAMKEKEGSWHSTHMNGNH